jgi:hypothetical protein
MTRPDVFAFQDSGLGNFLFAEVGTEINGSELTVLSVLARLGHDPWELAGQWAKLPKAMIIDRLTQSIVQMPLSEQARRDARQTATRLSLLLPTQPLLPTQSLLPKQTKRMTAKLPRWLPAAVGAAMLIIIISIIISANRNPNAPGMTLSGQSVPLGAQDPPD